jgi:hypothetical protein
MGESNERLLHGDGTGKGIQSQPKNDLPSADN